MTKFCMDYLCREIDYPQANRAFLNATRNRLRRANALTVAEQQRTIAENALCIAEFIAALCQISLPHELSFLIYPIPFPKVFSLLRMQPTFPTPKQKQQYVFLHRSSFCFAYILKMHLFVFHCLQFFPSLKTAAIYLPCFFAKTAK